MPVYQQSEHTGQATSTMADLCICCTSRPITLTRDWRKTLFHHLCDSERPTPTVCDECIGDTGLYRFSALQMYVMFRVSGDDLVHYISGDSMPVRDTMFTYKVCLQAIKLVHGLEYGTDVPVNQVVMAVASRQSIDLKEDLVRALHASYDINITNFDVHRICGTPYASLLLTRYCRSFRRIPTSFDMMSVASLVLMRLQ